MKNAGKKIKITNTTKDQRTWVYKIVTNVNDIDHGLYQGRVNVY